MCQLSTWSRGRHITWKGNKRVSTRRRKERESASSGKPKAADRVSSVTHKSRLNREQAKGLELYDVCSVRERDPTINFL